MGWFGSHLHSFYALAGVLLSAGLLVALLALWALSGLTEDVLEGETLRFDRSVLMWLGSNATPWLDSAAVKVTVLGDALVVVLVTVVSATLLWLMDRRRYAVLIASAVAGGWVLVRVLKELFDRSRPIQDEVTVSVTGAAYPSGHATMAMVLLVVLAYTVHRLRGGRRWLSVLAMGLASVLILLVGLSRLYLGVHYPTDVAAGYAVGFAWAVFCALAIEALPRVRERSGNLTSLDARRAGQDWLSIRRSSR